MLSLFADQEREAKLDSLGDPLALLDKHVDFAALAAEIDRQFPARRYSAASASSSEANGMRFLSLTLV